MEFLLASVLFIGLLGLVWTTFQIHSDLKELGVRRRKDAKKKNYRDDEFV